MPDKIHGKKISFVCFERFGGTLVFTGSDRILKLYKILRITLESGIDVASWINVAPYQKTDNLNLFIL